MGTKKLGSAGRFGPRYGSTIRKKITEIEKKQRKKQKCPYYGHTIKRLAKGLWKCTSCKKKFSGGAYYLQ